MSCDFFALPHPAIQTLIPYQPGKSVASLQQELGLTDIIKLASNENPLGCSPHAKKALRKLSVSSIAAYPAAFHHPLHQKLSVYHGLSPEQLLLANGSDSLFSLLMNTFALHTHKHILTHEYAFSAYAIQAQALGVPCNIVPIHPDWTVNIDALIEACTPQTALIFIANPNNPTGLAIAQHDLKRLLAHLPQTTLLVLDEAYIDYHPQEENTVDWLNAFPNLVLIRTFSKAYGLAGLRIGYVMAHPDIIQLLKRVQLPFSVNQAALDAANAALDDQAFIKKTCHLIKKGKSQLLAGFQRLKLHAHPAHANFITIDCKQIALPIYEKLLHHGIIVRPLAPYGLPQHLRITIGTTKQNTRLLHAFTNCIRTNS